MPSCSTLVDRDDQRDVMLLRARSCISRMVGPSGMGSVKSYQRGGLLGAEVRAVEDLLQADDLRAGFGGLLDVGDVLVDHGLLGGLERGVGRRRRWWPESANSERCET